MVVEASGRFEIQSRIAAGGMGEVYRARMISGGGAVKHVALKLVREELAADTDLVEMLVAEARVAMSLSHANIVQAFDAGRLATRFFFAMELIEGVTVAALQSRSDGPIPVAQAVTIAVEALKGLDYAHRFRDPEHGRAIEIVHRDVSPSNLLVSREGEVKVADFGIAQIGPTQSDGLIRGKRGYMAPEQLRGEPLDRRTDVYALGVVLYEMLVGSRRGSAQAHASDDPGVEAAARPWPSDTQPEVDGRLREIVTKATAPRPDARFASAAVMRQELERWAVERAILLSTADLADLVQDLPAKSPGDGADRADAPSLPEGTILERDTRARGGLTELVARRMDLGQAIEDALGEARTFDHTAPATASHVPPAPSARSAGGYRPWLALTFGALGLVAGGWWLSTSYRPPDAATPSDATRDRGSQPSAALEAPRALPPPPNTLTPDAAVRDTVRDTLRDTRPDAGSAPTSEPEPAADRVASGTARRRHRPAMAPPESPRPNLPARVWIASDPWALVTMDGQSLGRTTVNGVEVPPGRHVFVLSNPAASLTHRFTTQLAPGEDRRFSINLANP